MSEALRKETGRLAIAAIASVVGHYVLARSLDHLPPRPPVPPPPIVAVRVVEPPQPPPEPPKPPEPPPPAPPPKVHERPRPHEPAAVQRDTPPVETPPVAQPATTDTTTTPTFGVTLQS